MSTIPSIGKNLSALTLEDFKVTSPEGGLMGEYSVQLSTLDDGGQVAEMYSYVDEAAIAAMGWPSEPGWYTTASLQDYSCVPANDTIVPFGEGVMISSDCGATITFAGSIKEDETSIELNSQAENGGFTWTGNCSPVTIMFADIAVVGPEGGLMGEYSVQLSTLNDGGQVAEMYSYVDEAAIAAMGWPCEPGWYTTSSLQDYSCVPSGDSQLKAGECVMISSDCGATISIPSAL
jgi:hypothetical protein